jgi:hypothetical protein
MFLLELLFFYPTFFRGIEKDLPDLRNPPLRLIILSVNFQHLPSGFNRASINIGKPALSTVRQFITVKGLWGMPGIAIQTTCSIFATYLFQNFRERVPCLAQLKIY